VVTFAPSYRPISISLFSIDPQPSIIASNDELYERQDSIQDRHPDTHMLMFDHDDSERPAQHKDTHTFSVAHGDGVLD